MFQKKVAQEIKTHILCSIIFFSENRAVYGIIWKNVLELGRPQMTYEACAVHAGELKLHTHTHKICITYCFSTAAKVARTGLNVTLSVHYLSCSFFLTTIPDHYTLI